MVCLILNDLTIFILWQVLLLWYFSELNFSHQPVPKDHCWSLQLPHLHCGTFWHLGELCYKECGHEDQLVYLCPWMSSIWGKTCVLLDKVLKHNLKASPAVKTYHEQGESLLEHYSFESWSCIEADVDMMQLTCDRVPNGHPSRRQC